MEKNQDTSPKKIKEKRVSRKKKNPQYVKVNSEPKYVHCMYHLGILLYQLLDILKFYGYIRITKGHVN